MIQHETLYDWQKTAYPKWISQHKKGLLESPTGGGKTLFCLYCIQETNVRTIIIVPTIALLNQWTDEVEKHLGIKREDIGRYYGEEKTIKKVTIAVINSVRYKDLEEFEMVVCDEVDNFASLENIKALTNNPFTFRLGVTATLERADGRDEELRTIMGDVFFSYSQAQAQDDNVLNRFTLTNVGVEFNVTEKSEYDKQELFISNNVRTFGTMPAMTAAATNFRHPLHNTAKDLLRAIAVRRMLIANADAKPKKAAAIVSKHATDKVIIFNEYIGAAERIHKTLFDLGFKVGIYHSKEKNQDTIERFDKGEINVLVAVQNLNRGLNVKTANVGIIMSSNNVMKNTTQRIGRIIRKQEGKNAYIYQVYVRYSKENRDIFKRTAALQPLVTGEVQWQN